MTRDEQYGKMAASAAQMILQDVGYKLSDLLQGYPQAFHVFVLVGMQGVVNSVLPMLDETDRLLFDKLSARTTVVVAPPELDPRTKEGDNG